MSFSDYREACARARETHVAALEAQREKALSSNYTAKEYASDMIDRARQDPFERSMWVYFLRESGIGAIKIGTSKNVALRVRSIASGMPHGLTLLATMPGWHRVETLVHQLFEHARIRGEWFRPIPELLEYIDEIKSSSEHTSPTSPVEEVRSK